MIYYICESPEGVTLETVEKTAKALDPNYEKIDVPVDKAGLKGYLEPLFTQLRQPPTLEQVSAPAPAPAPEPVSEPAPVGINAHSICDWILDHATTFEVENVFEALGARFHELRDGRGEIQ